MLAVVVLAGLLPDTGVVSASSNCTYGSCPASSSFPIWTVSAAVAIVVLALIVALLLLRRSRRRPPSGESSPEAVGPDPGAQAEPAGLDTAPPVQGWDESAPPSDGTEELGTTEPPASGDPGA